MVCQVLASGSAGNCYLLKGKKESLILECGIKAGEIKKGLEYDLSGVCGCLCTHEHKDHSQAMKDMISLGIDVYASRGTLEALGIKSHRAKEIKPEREYKIGGFWVLPFLVEHDAREPLGFLIRHEEMGKLVFLTDTYTCPYRFLGVHHFLVEANYKRELIRDEVIADRLLKSHMEIEKTLDFLKANVSEETRTILLIHLSKKKRRARRICHRGGKTAERACEGGIFGALCGFGGKMKINNWFSHDSNARNDFKIINLRMRHGAAGYGVFFMIIERLREESNYMSIKDYNAIAFDLRVDASVVKSVIEDFGLFAFTEDGECFYSESLFRRMEIKDEKATIYQSRAKKGAAVRWNKAETKKTEKVKETDEKCLKHEKDMLKQCFKHKKYMLKQCFKHENSMLKISKDKLSKDKKEKKDKKENNICSPAANDSPNVGAELPFDYVFEEAWKRYPKKRGKNQISDTKKREIAKVGLAAMLLAVERYQQEVENMEERYILNGSTFFHGRYKDYLGEDYIPISRRKEEDKYAGLKEWLDGNK